MKIYLSGSVKRLANSHLSSVKPTTTTNTLYGDPFYLSKYKLERRYTKNEVRKMKKDFLVNRICGPLAIEVILNPFSITKIPLSLVLQTIKTNVLKTPNNALSFLTTSSKNNITRAIR